MPNGATRSEREVIDTARQCVLFPRRLDWRARWKEIRSALSHSGSVFLRERRVRQCRTMSVPLSSSSLSSRRGSAA